MKTIVRFMVTFFVTPYALAQDGLQTKETIPSYSSDKLQYELSLDEQRASMKVLPFFEVNAKQEKSSLRLAILTSLSSETPKNWKIVDTKYLALDVYNLGGKACLVATPVKSGKYIFLVPEFNARTKQIMLFQFSIEAETEIETNNIYFRLENHCRDLSNHRALKSITEVVPGAAAILTVGAE